MTQHPAWPAPFSTGALDATVDLPGSKSLTNRHLLLAALASEPTRLVAPLDSRDTRLMADALRSLGAEILQEEEDGVPVWSVTPLPAYGDRSAPGPAVAIDCGLAGTVMRFVPMVAALLRRPVTFDGDAGARVRPMGPVIDALKALGATVEGGEDGFLPFTVTGNASVVGGEIEVDSSGSSQFVSALLLAAPRLRDGLVVRNVGETLPSPQHVEMTLQVLRESGIEAGGIGAGAWRVAPGAPDPGDVIVEPDLSNAGPFLGAALVCGGTVRVPRWPETTTQIGALWSQLLILMGGTVLYEDGVLAVTGTGTLTGIDAADTGELAPTLAALAALAETPSRLTGIAHLRGHETDRLAALCTELSRVGIPAGELADGLAIDPTDSHPRPALWHSYADHRMATAGALIGLRIEGVEIEDVETTAKTLPDFVGMWQRMLATGTPPPVPAAPEPGPLRLLPQLGEEADLDEDRGRSGA